MLIDYPSWKSALNSVIDIFRPDGSVGQYRLLAARLPEFLAAYPPAKGYQVLIEATDALALRPGLLRLYQAAIEAGRTPSEAGLPALADATVMAFKASLLDAEGHILATASALKPIQSYKDWEIGETAARQRLLAALGFGGDVLAADEAGDLQAQGLATVPPATAGATQAPLVPRAAPAPPPAAAPAAAAPPAPPPAPPVPAASAPAFTPVVPTAAAAAPAGKPIPASVLRQIEHQARLKGVPTPVVNSLEQAKTELQRLFQLQPAAATPPAA